MVRRRKIMGLGVFGLAAALTGVCIVAVDRPAASFAHDAFRAAPAFVALTHLVDPLLPVTAIGFIGLGTAMLLGWAVPPFVRVFFCLCVASLLAIMIKDQLKYAFGRTWPETWINDNPSWIRNGIILFSPFHGGQGWASFPSGHTTMATAPMAVLIIALRSPWRWLAILPVILVAIGLYGADYHFVSDMIAGVMVGTLCAAMVTAMIAPALPVSR